MLLSCLRLHNKIFPHMKLESKNPKLCTPSTWHVFKCVPTKIIPAKTIKRKWAYITHRSCISWSSKVKCLLYFQVLCMLAEGPSGDQIPGERMCTGHSWKTSARKRKNIQEKKNCKIRKQYIVQQNWNRKCIGCLSVTEWTKFPKT